jgi:hypothetical protein
MICTRFIFETRRTLAIAMCVLASMSSCINTHAAPQPDELKNAIDRGINYLLSQQRADGAIADRANATAMTALALMAMASTGELPSDPTPHGEAMNRALKFMLNDSRHNPDGYFGEQDGSRMYGHGIVTLMLTELNGMGIDPMQESALHDKCKLGVNLILASQRTPKSVEFQGGWRYLPNSNDSDLSVSVWQLLALRSAANDQMDVPPEAISQAVAYLERSFTGPRNEDGGLQEESGGFGYMPGGSSPSFAMTAAGMLAIQICGEYDSPLVLAAERWLRDHPPARDERFFYYAMYYYAQAMQQRGDSTAEEAEKRVQQLLLPMQKADGSWEARSGEEAGVGSVYATAMSILSLSVSYHFLPIYQR